MVTKDYREALAPLQLEARSVALALSVLITRIITLPQKDRDDLFELVQALRTANEREEIAEIHTAMEEILAQEPVAAVKMEDKIGEGDGKLERWTAHVAKQIRTLRESAGMSQVQLAEKAGIPQSYVSRLENAQHSPTRMTLEKIAKALGVEVGKIDPCE